MPQTSWYYELKTHHSLSERVSHLMRPLVDAFSLDHLSFFSVDATGASSCLCSSPKWMELYLENELYLDNPFLKHPDLIEEGVFWSQRGPSLVLIKKEQGCLKGFSFGHAKDASLLVSEIPLLKRAFSWFEKEANSAIRGLASIDLIPLMKERFLQGAKEQMEEETRQALCEMMGISSLKLSKREKLCLVWVVRGLSARAIGEQLGLSMRTVESYLESAKAKLGVQSRFELVQLGLELLNLGLLP